MTRSIRRLVRLMVAALALSTGRAAAQEFWAPAPAADLGAAALLERGLPPSQSGFEAVALAIRWHGLPDLETRSLAIGASGRGARLALGLSQTGEGDLGWNALALAAGAGSEAGGCALRACGRRRLDATGALDSESGVEIGAGAWIAATEAVQVWASAPQLWTRGDPPPLERWLEVGTAFRIADARLWLVRAAAPGAPAGLRAEHVAGLMVPLGPAALWLEARDHPPRGGVGIEAGVARVIAAVEVDSHPVLGETVRLSLGWGARP